VRGECREVSAVVVAPGFDVVVIVRGVAAEACAWEEVVVCVCWEEGDGVAFPCWMAECARKAARKLERKGRFVGMLFEDVVGSPVILTRSYCSLLLSRERVKM